MPSFALGAIPRRGNERMLILLIVLLVLALGGGAFGQSRNWGYAGWSPLGIIIVLLLILWLTGNLH